MDTLKSWRAAFLMTLLAAAIATASINRYGAGSIGKGGPQDVITLDHKVSVLEQRFYAIDSRISRLEQQAVLSQRNTAPSAPGRDVELLRKQIDLLERRLAEIDCALVKLDERTLTAAARETRRSTEVNTYDACRRNAESPLRLSTRP